MSETLATATYRLARELGIVVEGVATGGSATTLIDTNDLTQADDYWNSASLWILRDAAEGGAAPEGQFAIVSDFTASSDTLSLRSTFAELITNGGFAADTDWTKGTGWAIAAGLATKTAGTGSDLEQDISVTEAQTYTVIFTVSGRTAGTIVAKVAGTSGTSRSTNATFTENIVAGSGTTPRFELTADSSFDGSVDNVSVISSALSVAAASGDRYALGKKRYPLHILIQKVNQALTEMGTIPITDTTTVDTASTKTEYSLPIAANTDLREVWFQTITGDTNDNRWRKMHDWYIQKSATGVADLLMLPVQYPAPRDIKIVYMDVHPSLDDHDDKISEHVHISRVVMEATVLALMWRKQRVGAGDPTLNDQLAFYTGPQADGLSRLAKARRDYPIRAPQAHRRFLVMGQRIAEDEFYTPPAP